MVLDREQDKSVGVLLKQRLVGLNFSNLELSLRRLSRLLCNGHSGGVDDSVGHGRVLLARGFEVELLDRGVVHLKVLEGGSSLFKSIVSCFLSQRRVNATDGRHTCLEGVSCADIVKEKRAPVLEE